MLLKKGGEDAYFIASNSKSGFCSYYESCFHDARIGRVFAVLGGPGTGKSYFLRAVAKAGERAGRTVEYIYCSSDPLSLDGVIVTGGGECLALLDATPPHSYEATRPGLREEVVDLGGFWDRLCIVHHREEIEQYNRQKSDAYRRAYRYLCGVGELLSVREELVSPFVRTEAVAKCAERLMREIPQGRGYAERITLMRSIGMQGCVTLGGMAEQALHCVRIHDCRGIARYLMRELAALARLRQQPIRISYDPIDPRVIDAILFCDVGLIFAVMPQEELSSFDRALEMRRFLDVGGLHTQREALNHCERSRRMLSEGVQAAFADVKTAHFALESIYSSAMDFCEKERFTKKFCEELFDLQKP